MMYGNWHLAAQVARDRQDELVHAAARERMVAAVAGPSLRERLARALTRRDNGATAVPVRTSAPSTMGAQPSSVAGN